MRLGEVIERDMIAVPVSAEQRQIVVAAPSYFEKAGVPRHPRDLMTHRTIGWKSAVDAAPYRWEFTEGDRNFAIAADAEIATNDMALMVNLARSGAGVTIGMEETFSPWLATGELQTTLDEFSPPMQGFYLFYPSKRHLPPKLCALVDHVQAWRRRRMAGGSASAVSGQL